jgi:hypothetical protein
MSYCKMVECCGNQEYCDPALGLRNDILETLHKESCGCENSWHACSVERSFSGQPDWAKLKSTDSYVEEVPRITPVRSDYWARLSW